MTQEFFDPEGGAVRRGPMPIATLAGLRGGDEITSWEPFDDTLDLLASAARAAVDESVLPQEESQGEQS